jgi:hypothetical protein
MELIKLSENNNHNVNTNLSDVLYNMFDTTARGITYWRKHRTHKCYKCKAYGHIAPDCDNICNKCGNLHNKTVCVHSIEALLRKINKTLQSAVIKDPERLMKNLVKIQEEIEIEDLRSKQGSFSHLTIANPSSFSVVINSISKSTRNFDQNQSTCKNILENTNKSENLFLCSQKIRCEYKVLETKNKVKISKKEINAKIEDKIFPEVAGPHEELKQKDPEKNEANKKQKPNHSGGNSATLENSKKSVGLKKIRRKNKEEIQREVNEIEGLLTNKNTINIQEPKTINHNEALKKIRRKETEAVQKEENEIKAFLSHKGTVNIQEPHTINYEFKLPYPTLQQLTLWEKEEKIEKKLRRIRLQRTQMELFLKNNTEIKKLQKLKDDLEKQVSKGQSKVNLSQQKLKQKWSEFNEAKNTFYRKKQQMYRDFRKVKDNFYTKKERIMNDINTGAALGRLRKKKGQYRRNWIFSKGIADTMEDYYRRKIEHEMKTQDPSFYQTTDPYDV